MVRVGLNGLGRIGKRVLHFLLNESDVEIIFINDKNKDISNVAYMLNYDSIYGNEILFSESSKDIMYKDKKLPYYSFDDPTELLSNASQCDLIIDATGVSCFSQKYRKLINSGIIKKALITHSPGDEDITVVIGSNEHLLDNDKHNVISTSICDASAIAPILSHIDANFGIENGFITTLHPWLNYQNLLDGPSSSWSSPGETYHHYSLGRASFNNLIPKTTSAVEVALKSFVPKKTNLPLGSFSYRTPTNIVCSADLTLNICKKISNHELKDFIFSLENIYKQKIFNVSDHPLVSSDFIKNDFSCNIDNRWTEVIDDSMIKLVLWYDNEYAYSKRVIDILKMVSSDG